VAQRALGTPAVSFGDYHVAKDITWALLGESHGDDVLAEVLEPYRATAPRAAAARTERLPAARRGPRRGPRTHLPR
jgi:hypothetical protein